MVLDATVGGTDSNSYITTDEADMYHDARLHNDDWFNASIEKREVALQWATSLLDDLDWKGAVADTDQRLSWPRVNVYKANDQTRLLPSTEIPSFLVKATSELAWEIMKKDRLVDSENMGIAQVMAGEVMVKFNKNDRPTKLPTYVMRLIQPYLHTTYSNFVDLSRA